MWFNLGNALWQYDLGNTSWHSFRAPKPEHGVYGWLAELSIDSNNQPFAAFALCGGASCFGPVDSFLVEENGRIWVIGAIDGQVGLWRLEA